MVKRKSQKLPTKYAPGIYLFACLCFCLPFVSITCQGQDLVMYNGFQLVKGIEYKDYTGNVQKMEPEIYAILAFVAVFLGAMCLLFKSPLNFLLAGVLGIVAAVFLILMKIKFDDQAIKQGQGVILLRYALGFWGALLIALFGGVVNIVLFKESPRSKRR